MTSQTINSVNQLRLKYPGEETLLFKDLSISIRKGEKVLLLGPSGSGKSTLLQVLSGLVPDALELPMKCKEQVVPKRWGYVFQDPDTQFCMPYADEELAFTLENLQVPQAEMPGLIRKYMEMVGLHFEDLHVPISTFSQGMKQRLAIAAALALEPEVLYLDEPTALLDPEGTAQVWETIQSLSGERTLLIVEHKISKVLQDVDRVILFNEAGEIIADKAPEQFFTEERESLIECGLWYPSIWQDYDARHRAEKRDVPETGGPIVVIRDFVGYRGKQPKIHVPEATVHAGEWISVVGSNGAGKSTLLLAIMRLIQTAGDCQVGDYAGEKTIQIAQRTGFVFQNPELQFLTDSVEDELMFGLLQTNKSQVQCKQSASELLTRFRLDGYQDRHPYQLSMGQKRRLSVATAVSGGKPLLLLDEPTFGLDAISTFQTLELLEELRRKGTAIIMVTHDLDIASRFSTRIWTIEEGLLREDKSC